jgi:hypothetical protein
MFRPARAVFRPALLASLAFALPAAAHSQAGLKEILDQQGEWVLERWDIYMGPSTDCLSGQSYAFGSGNVLEIRRCIDRRIQKEASTWRLQQQSGQPVLVIGTTTYEIAAATRSKIDLVLRQPATGAVSEELQIAFLED